jgi:uncharacterized integral membrane protein (TIGR00698 family)
VNSTTQNKKNIALINLRQQFTRSVAHATASYAPGLLMTGVIGMAGVHFARLEWMQKNGFSGLTLAILFGIIGGNLGLTQMMPSLNRGILFSKQNLLRLGIILYGFRLTFQDIGQIGMTGFIIDLTMVVTTFMLAVVLGAKLLKIDRTTSILIGAGSSICGAAAVIATEPVVQGRTEQVTVAVSTVVVFGTLAIFIYPLLYHLNVQYHFIEVSSFGFGIYAGSTIHEVAQVVATAKSISQDAANTAVIVKMVRVMMLAPFLVALSFYMTKLGRRHQSIREHIATSSLPRRLTIPWFAFIFVGIAGLNSMIKLPAGIHSQVLDVDTVLLAMAMAALGLTTQFSAIRKAGIKPLVLAFLLFTWLVCGGAFINHTIPAYIK